MTNNLLTLVDNLDFRGLFVEALGWGNPDQQPQHVTVDDQNYTLTQIAGYKGLRIWHCPALPPRPIQRRIDQVVGSTSTERLLIFTGPDRQDWRWPRRRQLGTANAKLLVHEHRAGQSNPGLLRRLQAVELDLEMDLSLIALLERMREAFDAESETASVQAARLMRVLYSDLEAASVGEHDATLLLARLLFLFFGDDADMWEKDLFHCWIRDHTSGESLHSDLHELFIILNTPEGLRVLAAGSPFADFRYINGGLFSESMSIPPLNEAFRHNLLEACEFDWSIISPAIFGSMFQTVKSKEARRGGGEHYTTEDNIRKTIDPLFLDGLKERLETAWNDKAQLTRLHNDLGRMRVFDPACGCGNFLIVAYRELRAIELELLKRRRDLDVLDRTGSGPDRSQLTFDVTGDIKVSLDHFYGIEILEWPARIAETAMLLVDHLANQRMALEFGQAPDRLPIQIAPTIVHRNAIREDWRAVLGLKADEVANDVVVLGNPPFVGMAWLDEAQQEDNRIAFRAFNIPGSRTGRLDYVACWYAKAIQLLASSTGRAAFVSTNSITQGDQARAMVPLLVRHGFKVDFGHRTFKWTSEAPGAAAVHVVIVGFSPIGRRTAARLFDYPIVAGHAVEIPVGRLNFYLVDGPDLAPVKLRAPLVTTMPNASKGSQPTDGGFLIVSGTALAEIQSDKVAVKFLRRFVQSQEMLHGGNRWCLWLGDATQAELNESPILRDRMLSVAAARRGSPTLSVRQAALTPHLFTQVRQPTRRYIALPEVSSENREWIPGTFFGSDVIAGNKLIVWDSDTLWHFAFLQSSLYMAWIRTYCGRLESRYSLSPGLVYFPFPFVIPNETDKELIEAAVGDILAERARHPGRTLAGLYDPREMPENLRKFHYELDKHIDRLYGLRQPTEGERMKAVMVRYQDLTRSARR